MLLGRSWGPSFAHPPFLPFLTNKFTDVSDWKRWWKRCHNVTHLRRKRRWWWHFLADLQNVVHKIDFHHSNSALILFFHLQHALTYKSFILQNITFVTPCDWQHLRWLLVVSTSWYLCPCAIPSPWVSARPKDLLLMDYGKSDGIFDIVLLLRLSLKSLLVSLAHPIFLSHWLTLKGASCYVISCSVEESASQETDVSSRQLLEDLSPGSSSVSELGSGSFPSWAFMWAHSHG